MTDNKFVYISAATYVRLQGQIGNMDVVITKLQHVFIDAGMSEMVEMVEELRVELDFFRKYLPPHTPHVPF